MKEIRPFEYHTVTLVKCGNAVFSLFPIVETVNSENNEIIPC